MQVCHPFTRKTIQKIRSDFSKKTRTSLSSFHWENRTDFKEKIVQLSLLLLGKPYRNFVRIFSKEKRTSKYVLNNAHQISVRDKRTKVGAA